MRQSATAPNLQEYTQQNNNYQSNNNYQNNNYHDEQRKPAYSRHYDYDYNGHRVQRPTNGYHDDENHDNQQPIRGNLKPSTSLSLLPLSRDANALTFKDKYNRPGSDWNLTTTKRAFR